MSEPTEPRRTDALAARIRARGLPAAVATIALEGGAAVHPALRGHTDAVDARGWAVANRHPELVPLWTSGAVVTLAAGDGSVSRWSPELPDEPLHAYADLAEAVRALLTDLWELDDDDTGAGDRRAIAEALLRPDQVAAALVPVER